MKFRLSSRWMPIAIGIAAIGLSLLMIAVLTRALFDFGSSVPSISSVGGQVGQGATVPSVGIPIRLTIPEIHVDAAIEDVGLTPQGAMAVPAGPVDVAWFDLGPRPGETGSAVIAGHEGWKDGIAAAFDNLHTLETGDKIYVAYNTGATSTFVVRDVQIYSQNADASDIFSSSDGKVHLNLITCEGTWNAAQKSYSNRLVVFADEDGSS